ncbi:winged helix DNA-binding domain-containing protein [Streptomyces sp. NBC_00859]|uniref:winged helix DNA-binding domain-containing protein n=1 Tax=Streptomyces sp. NBC_00859 TaxID=2903682 RepID=UPI00386FAAD1|nr:winged helix DNA-binding domain-containing protein [Streptomyces sp. NBC_00859]
MRDRWTAADVRRRRAAAQLLGAESASGPADAVRRVVGVQSQDVKPARLAVRARSTGLTAGDVDARCTSGELVRTWLMRGTLHMVIADDVRWLLRLFGERTARRQAGRRRRLGLDEDTCRRGLDALRAVLAGSAPLTRATLMDEIAREGVALDPRSQAPAHLLQYAAVRGLVCRGPEDEHDGATYTLLADRAGPAQPGDEDADLARLALRYVTGHGPTGPPDLAAWSGLPLTSAGRAFALAARELCEVATELGPLHELPERAGEAVVPHPDVRLLGHFDGYLLGYRDRTLIVPPAHDRAVQSGGGFIMPTFVADGRALGTWSVRHRRHRMTVEITPFDDGLDAGVREGLHVDAADLGRYLGVPAHVTV